MKRVFDSVVAAAVLLFTSPLVLVAVISIKLSTPGPVFYSGPRVGLGGRVFDIHKLRTMRGDAELSGPAVTVGDDPRVTHIGRVLRRTKIDELPQLWNVLKGDMSLVGPRPEHPDFVAHYTPEQRRLLGVRPGVTGASALAFIDEEQELRGSRPEQRYLDELMPTKLDLELRYLERASFRADLGVLVRTAALVVRRPFAS